MWGLKTWQSIIRNREIDSKPPIAKVICHALIKLTKVKPGKVSVDNKNYGMKGAWRPADKICRSLKASAILSRTGNVLKILIFAKYLGMYYVS